MGQMSQEEINVSLFDELKALQKENAILRKGIAAVRALIVESEGVTGLHQNGDTAPWDSLLPGGGHEEWLLDFSKADSI